MSDGLVMASEFDDGEGWELVWADSKGEPNGVYKKTHHKIGYTVGQGVMPIDSQIDPVPT